MSRRIAKRDYRLNVVRENYLQGGKRPVRRKPVLGDSMIQRDFQRGLGGEQFKSNSGTRVEARQPKIPIQVLL